ncbi:MAG: hypothetical protein ACFFCS_18770 [Candidatus Hodarchaeota archaeon]
MASPCALKMGPLTNAACPKNRYYLIQFLIMWLSLVPAVVVELYYFGLLFDWNPLKFNFIQISIDFFNLMKIFGDILLWALFPFNLLFVFYLYTFCSIKVAKFFLFCETKLYPPREGVFPRDYKDKDFLHWHARRVIKKFPCWLVQLTPFPWMKRSYIYNQLGARVGKNVGIMDSWVDLEFVTIEDDVSIGRGAAITSHYFTSKALILKSIIVKKDSLVGDKVRVLPGATIGEQAVLISRSVIKLGEQVPSESIFAGNPAEQVEIEET